MNSIIYIAMTTSLQLLNIEDIAVGPLQDSSIIPPQRIAWISSNTTNSRLLIQSPEFITETHGVLREGPFYTIDKPRAFYKRPFCHARQKHSEELGYEHIAEFYRKRWTSALALKSSRTSSLERRMPRNTSITNSPMHRGGGSCS